MGEAIKVDTISRLHELVGYDKPKDPLITLIDFSNMEPIVATDDLHIATSLYSISLKEGTSCKTKLGRQNYDFKEGSLSFLAPEQNLYIVEDDPGELKSNGWNLSFHPDLLYRTSLEQKIKEYTFFTYNVNEALHLSVQEKQKITEIVADINNEINENIDVVSKDLIISYLELLLNYCTRFYSRQFITRTKVNKDAIIRFEDFLRSYFYSDKLQTNGLPNVKYCAHEMGYSPNYLSDLLKKETGKNTQEHIHYYLIEKAKTLLLGTEKPVNLIAIELGFEYPQHFSKLFKNKTGMSPVDFRH